MVLRDLRLEFVLYEILELATSFSQLKSGFHGTIKRTAQGKASIIRSELTLLLRF